MAQARAEDNNSPHNGTHYLGSGGGAGKVSNQIKLDSDQYKEQSNQYKGNSNNQGRELNPQPLPPGMKQQ